MASDKPVFCRPIEITTSSDTMSINVNGAGANTRTVNNGVYGCISSLLSEMLNTTLATDSLHCWLDTDFKVHLAHATLNFTIDWTDTNLRDLLGFTANLSGGQNYTATHTPASVWFPATVRSDRDAWAIMQKDAVKGLNAHGGRFAGFATGSLVYEQRAEFMYENAVNVLGRFATDDYEFERTFERFIYRSRSETITVSGNSPLKGFYFVPDYTDFTGSFGSENLNATMDSGGINYSYSSGADEYTYCHIMGSTSPAKVMLPVTRTKYQVALPMVTATAPTWTGE